MALAQDQYPHLAVWAMAEARRLRRAAPAPTRAGDHPAGTGPLPGWSTHPDQAAVAATSHLRAVPPPLGVGPLASSLSGGGQDFGLQASYSDDNAVLAVLGEVDVATASQLEDCLLGLLHRPLDRLTVDMSATTFIDSSGLTALVAGLSTARERGVEVTLASPTAAVLKILESAGVGQTLRASDAKRRG